MKGIKRMVTMLVIMVIIFGGFTACDKISQSTWQEQYDLGMQYLEEGDYEQAIVAFTAAIEIDPKQAVVYVARANAYMSVENIENSSELALSDYQMAAELEPDSEEIYFGLIEMYANIGDIKTAINMLKDGIGERYADDSESYLEAMDQVTTFCMGNDFVQSEELTINGIPFSASTIRDAMAAYPSDEERNHLGTVDDEVVYDVEHSANGKRSSTTKFIQKANEDTLESVSYSKIPYVGDAVIKIDSPEVRTIQVGDSQKDVLQKLGFTEQGIAYITNDLMFGSFRWNGNKWMIRQDDKDAIMLATEMYSPVSQIVISWTNESESMYLLLLFDEEGLCRLDIKRS